MKRLIFICAAMLVSLVATAQTWKKLIPVVTENSVCNSSVDTVGVSADRTKMFTCQSGAWRKSGGQGGGGKIKASELVGVFCPSQTIVAPDAINGSLNISYQVTSGCALYETRHYSYPYPETAYICTFVNGECSGTYSYNGPARFSFSATGLRVFLMYTHPYFGSLSEYNFLYPWAN